MFTLIQISDTHLRQGDPVSEPGWRAAARHIAAARPDLIVHTGDIVRAEPETVADHAFARRALDALGVDWLAVAGNHDIGDGPPSAVTITARLVDRFAAVYGAVRWARDIGTWRLLGINSMLFGSGLAEEEAEWRFLEAAVRTAEHRDLALFVHKPPFVLDPAEAPVGSMAMPHAARARFWGCIQGGPVRLIACGHRHEHRVVQHGGITMVWAPATAALPETTPPLTGSACGSGLLEYCFAERTVVHRLVSLPGS